MAGLTQLSDAELSQMLKNYGVNVGPINGATRGTYERRLAKLQTEEPTPPAEVANDVDQSIDEESQNTWNDLERTLRHEELSQSVSSVAELSEQKMASENQLSLKDVEIVECEASERKVSSKDEELSRKSQDIIELEKQLQTLQNQQEVLKNEHHQQEMLSKEKIAQLEMAVIKKTQESEMFVIQFSQVKTTKEATTEELALLQKELLKNEQKVQELEKELVRRGNLDKMFVPAELEKYSLRETVKKVELDNQLLGDKVKEMEKEVEGLMQEKNLWEKKVVRLEFDNFGLEVKEMDKVVDDLVNEKASLEGKVMKLKSCNCQSEDRLKELEKVDDLTTEKVSLQTEINKLECDNCQLEDKLKKLDQIIKNAAIEKVSLQDQVQALQSSNCQLEDKLKELSQKVESITLEKVSFQDRLQMLESAKDQLENQLKEMEVAASEYVQLKERFEVQEKTLAEKLQELSQSVAEKALTEKNLQLLRKWESRCSELSAQLAMDHKKIQRLTEQALKEELDEVKQEKDRIMDKYVIMFKSANTHLRKFNKQKSLNEQLNSRNELLYMILAGKKPEVLVPGTDGDLVSGAQNQDSEPGTGMSTEMPRTAQENSGGLLFGE